MSEDRIRRPFVGFYWTMPVRWTGFVALPSEIEAAARVSKTIRYQRAIAARHVAFEEGELVGEIAVQDVSPDRGTGALRDDVRKAGNLCRERGATLLLVDFSECGWRRHAHIEAAIREFGIESVRLPPETIRIDTIFFSPRKHFSAWRVMEKQERERRKVEVPVALRAALDAVPEGRGRYQKIAELLNAQRTPTIGGGMIWKRDNVKKAIQSLAEGDRYQTEPAAFF